MSGFRKTQGGKPFGQTVISVKNSTLAQISGIIWPPDWSARGSLPVLQKAVTQTRGKNFSSVWEVSQCMVLISFHSEGSIFLHNPKVTSHHSWTSRHHQNICLKSNVQSLTKIAIAHQWVKTNRLNLRHIKRRPLLNAELINRGCLSITLTKDKKNSNQEKVWNLNLLNAASKTWEGT